MVTHPVSTLVPSSGALLYQRPACWAVGCACTQARHAGGLLQESYTPIDHINNWKENQKSPYFSKTDKKVINHVGEVRRQRAPVNGRAESLCTAANHPVAPRRFACVSELAYVHVARSCDELRYCISWRGVCSVQLQCPPRAQGNDMQLHSRRSGSTHICMQHAASHARVRAVQQNTGGAPEGGHCGHAF